MEGRKPATIKVRNGGTFKAPVFMVSRRDEQVRDFRDLTKDEIILEQE